MGNDPGMRPFPKLAEFLQRPGRRTYRPSSCFTSSADWVSAGRFSRCVARKYPLGLRGVRESPRVHGTSWSFRLSWRGAPGGFRFKGRVGYLVGSHGSAAVRLQQASHFCAGTKPLASSKSDERSGRSAAVCAGCAAMIFPSLKTNAPGIWRPSPAR